MEVLRSRVEREVKERMPASSTIPWCSGTTGRREVTKIELADAGYAGGEAAEAARWVTPVFTTWLDILRRNPIEDLDEQVEALVADTVVDDDELPGTHP